MIVNLWLRYVKWLVNLSYVIVLVLGAKALLESREQGLSIFQSGDFVFQLSPGQNLPDVLQRLNFFAAAFQSRNSSACFCIGSGRYSQALATWAASWRTHGPSQARTTAIGVPIIYFSKAIFLFWVMLNGAAQASGPTPHQQQHRPPTQVATPSKQSMHYATRWCIPQCVRSIMRSKRCHCLL